MTWQRIAGNFCKAAGASLGVLAMAWRQRLRRAGAIAANPPMASRWPGVFPIGWTPCKPDNSFDADAMVKQQQFLNRGKVAGMAWPQNASGWQSLTRGGMECGRRSAGVGQGRHRAGAGRADRRLQCRQLAGLCQKGQEPECRRHHLPDSARRSDADIIAYFKALSDASGLPIMVQAVGDVSVDQLGGAGGGRSRHHGGEGRGRRSPGTRARTF